MPATVPEPGEWYRFTVLVQMPPRPSMPCQGAHELGRALERHLGGGSITTGAKLQHRPREAPAACPNGQDTQNSDCLPEAGGTS